MSGAYVLSRERGATERLLAALRSPNAAALTDFELSVAGVRLREQTYSVEWGREEDERPGRLLTATLEWQPPLDVKGEPVILDLLIDGVRIRAFTGKAWLYSSGDGPNELTAHTGGYWLDKIGLPEDKGYFGESHKDVVYEALLLNSEYDAHFITVDDPPAPARFGSGGTETNFRRKLDKINAVLDSVFAEVDYRFADNALNGHDATLARSPAEAGEVVASFVAGQDFEREEFNPEPLGDEFSEVLVYRELQDGDFEELALVPIPDSRAPEGTTYEIPITDDDPLSDEEAWEKGNLVAARFGTGESSAEFPVPKINPLIDDGSFISVRQPFERNGITGMRHWIAEVSLSRSRIQTGEGGEKTQTFTIGSMVRAREDLAPPPKVAPLGKPRESRRLVLSYDTTLSSVSERTLEELQPYILEAASA